MSGSDDSRRDREALSVCVTHLTGKRIREIRDEFKFAIFSLYQKMYIFFISFSNLDFSHSFFPSCFFRSFYLFYPSFHFVLFLLFFYHLSLSPFSSLFCLSPFLSFSSYLYSSYSLYFFLFFYSIYSYTSSILPIRFLSFLFSLYFSFPFPASRLHDDQIAFLYPSHSLTEAPNCQTSHQNTSIFKQNTQNTSSNNSCLHNSSHSAKSQWKMIGKRRNLCSGRARNAPCTSLYHDSVVYSLSVPPLKQTSIW